MDKINIMLDNAILACENIRKYATQFGSELDGIIKEFRRNALEQLQKCTLLLTEEILKDEDPETIDYQEDEVFQEGELEQMIDAANEAGEKEDEDASET